jgi:hypothetical protein
MQMACGLTYGHSHKPVYTKNTGPESFVPRKLEPQRLAYRSGGPMTLFRLKLIHKNRKRRTVASYSAPRRATAQSR